MDSGEGCYSLRLGSTEINLTMASWYLSEVGEQKVREAYRNKFPDDEQLKIVNLEELTILSGDKVHIQTISKIINGRVAVSESSIRRLFVALGLKLEEKDLTKANKENYNREGLCYQAKHQNLPPQSNSFIGRKKELKELFDFLSDDFPQPIVQVDGIGGVGKTALVLEAAYLCLEKRENLSSPEIKKEYKVPSFGAIIWISAKETQLLSIGIGQTLQAQRTLQEIYRTIADVFDDPAILDDTDRKHHENIINKIRNAPDKTLLVIDNLETIENKKKIVVFVQKLHNTKVVITTREQAGIYANIRLSELSQSESLELIDQQLQLADINLNENEKEKLIDVSNSIPLVIIYSIGRLANQKHNNPHLFELVINDILDEDGDISHFCFRKSVDDIRDQPAYWLLMSIAIFDKAPCYEALVEVAGLSAEPRRSILRQLEILQIISFIRFNRDRYYMLPITREYALAQLNRHPEFRQDALDRWIEYYIDLAKCKYENQSKNERMVNFYEFLDDEWKNFLGVLRCCKDRCCKDNNFYAKLKELWSYLNNYSNIRGRWKDRLDWLEWLIDNSKHRKEYKETVHFIIRRGRILLLMGKKHDLEAAQKLFLEAWNLRQKASFDDIDYLTNHLAATFARLGDYQQAHEWLDEEQNNINSQPPSGDLTLYQIYVNRERAELFLTQGEYDQSKDLCYKVIQKSQEINSSRNENYVKKLLADIAIQEGNLDLAEELLNVGFEEVSMYKDKRRIAYYQVALCLLEQKKGDLLKAKDWLGQAINNFKYLGMSLDLDNAKQIQRNLKQDTT